MGMRWQDGGYSSHVEIFLLLEGARLPVRQVGPNSLILRDPVEVPHGHARILVIVDGEEEIHDVIIHSRGPVEAELEFA
jgi:hypothetical protein